jgi:lipopolysaccharide transport system ATP-binding protein
VLFVSHDISALKSLCSRGVYLEHGTVRAIGNAPDVAAQYIKTMREEMNAEHRKYARVAPEFMPENKGIRVEVAQPLEKSSVALKRSDEFDKRVAPFRYGSGGARITYVELLNMDDEPIQTVEFNQEVKIRIFCEVEVEMEFGIAFQILDAKQINIIGSGFREVCGETLFARSDDRYAVTYTLKLPLREGAYSIQVHIGKPIPGSVRPDFIDVVPDTNTFKVMCREPVAVGSAVYIFPKMNIEKLSN